MDQVDAADLEGRVGFKTSRGAADFVGLSPSGCTRWTIVAERYQLRWSEMS